MMAEDCMFHSCRHNPKMASPLNAYVVENQLRFVRLTPVNNAYLQISTWAGLDMSCYGMLYHWNEKDVHGFQARMDPDRISGLPATIAYKWNRTGYQSHIHFVDIIPTCSGRN